MSKTKMPISQSQALKLNERKKKTADEICVLLMSRASGCVI